MNKNDTGKIIFIIVALFLFYMFFRWQMSIRQETVKKLTGKDITIIEAWSLSR